ncbi:MAG: hypothetical protein ABWY02_10880 [Telluria sp.]
MATSRHLATGLPGVRGGRLQGKPADPASLTYTFVQHGGQISTIRLDTGALAVRGSGYADLEDIAVSSDGERAFVSDRSAIHALDFTQPDLDRAVARTIVSGLAEPRQLAVARGDRMLYVVEYGSGKLQRIEIATGTATTIADGLDGPAGLALDEAKGLAYVTLGRAGTLVAVGLADGAASVLLEGLVAPQFLAWDGSGRRRSLLIAEGSPADRVRLYDLASGTAYYCVRDGAPRGTSMALALNGRDVIVSGDGSVVRFERQPGHRQLATLRLQETRRPFLATYQRVTASPGEMGLTMLDVTFRVAEGVSGGQVSLARDRLFDPDNPEVMLLVGSQVGDFRLQMIEAGTGTVVGEAPYTITDVWRDREKGPARWGQGKFEQFTRGAAWGGGPEGPQNVDVIPATGPHTICMVMVDTSSSRFEPERIAQVRDTYYNETVGGVTGADGVVRSAKIFFDEMKLGGFGFSLLDDRVFGPVSLPSDWDSYLVSPAPEDETRLDYLPGSVVAAAVSAANALVDDTGTRLIDFTRVKSFMVVLKSNGPKYVWPRAWGDMFNIIKPDGEAETVALQWLVMPDDWAYTPTIHPTVAHELGHNLYMGDLYRMGSLPAERALGNYDCMHAQNNLPFLCVPHRLMLGWARPEWVRTFDFSVSGTVDETVVLAPVARGAPPAGQYAAIEVRIANGHNYYFEYRLGQPGHIGDQRLGETPDTVPRAVLGTDCYTTGVFAPPFERPAIVRLRPDAEGEQSFFAEGQDYKELDTDEPSHFAPAEFQMEVLRTGDDSADVRIRYGANLRPDPAIRPWPSPADAYQSPDIEIRNMRNAVAPEWFNVPWPGHDNEIVATVRNNSARAAPGVQVEFLIHDLAVGAAAPMLLDTATQDLPAGNVPVEFKARWFVTGSGHRCVIARIPLYQDPGDRTVVELSQLNNEARSNYTRVISESASPSSRMIAEIAVMNPYPVRTQISVAPQQPGDLSRYYRVYLQHSSLVLDPGEVRKVKVMFESLAGLPEVDAELRQLQLLKRFYSEDNKVNFIGFGYPPGTPQAHTPDILGGATVAVKSGRATRFQAFEGNSGGAVRGRVVTLDRGEPANGVVLVTALLDGAPPRSIDVDLRLDARGEFADVSRLGQQLRGRKIARLDAHYPGAFALASCDAGTLILLA